MDVESIYETSVPPVPLKSPFRPPPRSPLRDLHIDTGDWDSSASWHSGSESSLPRFVDSNAYFDAQLEIIDRTIDEVQSSWPVLHGASACVSPAISPDDASSVYSTPSEQYLSDTPSERTPSFTASSRPSSSSDSMIGTPQSETPPMSATFAPYHKLTTLDYSFPGSEAVSTTDNVFELISQIPIVESMQSLPEVEVMDDTKSEDLHSDMFNYFPPSPVVRPMVQRSSSRMSRTYSLRSSANSIVDKPSSKRSSLLMMPKRMSSLLLSPAKRRQFS